MSNYGIPYMGSKGGIVKEVVGLFPKAENFYDLFGGGFSITHGMLVHRSKDYKYFHFNEIRKGVCELVQDAISGKYNYKVFKPKWISREEFEQRKESDAYIKLVWSFGNNGEDYLFGQDIEYYKKTMHNAVVFGEFNDLAKQVIGIDKWAVDDINERRLFLRYRLEQHRLKGIPDFLKPYLSEKQLKELEKIEHLRKLERLQQLQQLEQLQQLGRLEQLQQLERLQQLQQLGRLSFYNLSYEQVEIKSNSVIYCDPPYSGTAEYDNNSRFNHARFLDWADAQENPVFISEYNISDKRFKLVKSIKKRSMLSSNKDKCADVLEKIYINKAMLRFLNKK